jgi:hypothetical protein
MKLEPTKVEVVSPVPIPVVISGDAKQSQLRDPSLPATTTFQDDLTTAGQRNINLIWESTQGKIALYVIVGTMIIDGSAILFSVATGHEMTAAVALALGFVNSLATGVVSFYFSRTNHTQIGGIGAKPNEPYVGR